MRGLIGVLRTWNRQHILLLEQPAQRHLTWRFAVTITDQLQQCHYRLHCVKLRTAERFTKAADASRSAAIEIFAGQRTTCERLVSDQGNAEFAARVQHAIGFRLPVQQGILDLVGGKRNAAFSQRLVRGPQLRGGVVADTDGLDLSCLDSIRHQPHQRGNVHPRARKMMLVQLDRTCVAGS